MIVVLLSLAVALILANRADGFPVNSLKNANIPSTKVLDFLTKFGYVEDDDETSGALYTETGVSEIIKVVQKFGGLEQTGLLDNATLALMSSPRCGVPDIIKNKRIKRFAVGSPGWNKRTITYFIANWAPTLGEPTVLKNIRLSFDTWGKYGRLKFRRSLTLDADIVIAFGKGYHGDRFPFDGPGNILAHAFFPSEEAGLGGDIHFDADENWTDRSEGQTNEGVDFSTVALHESGHSLGLSHSAEPNSVMFPYYRSSDGEFQLGYDDVLAMYELYIRRNIIDDTTETTHDGLSPKATTESISTTFTSYTPAERTDKIETTTIYINTSTLHHTINSLPPVTINYEGDNESIDDHRKHDPKHDIPSTNSPSLPNICDGHLDAVAVLRGEIFIFKEQYVWRLKQPAKVEPGYPILIRHMFMDLPEAVKKIDAAYERPDGTIVLFIGANFWVYDGENFIGDSPTSLANYGLPTTLDKVDAVQVWARNGKTYIYSKDHFWRYNDTSRKMDEGYPKHMERWRGVPHSLDAATTWNGITHFFKDELYWKFDNDWVMTTEQSPFPTPQLWLGCPEDDRSLVRLPDHHY